MPYVKTSIASEHFGVHPNTLRRWADSEQIKYYRSSNNTRFYWIEENKKNITKNDYVYVRVSSSKQKDDLQRQADFMSQRYPKHKIIKDIGSGLNFKRKGLCRLLEKVQTGSVREIVVASKDRLCRFGYELIEQLCTQFNTKLVVLKQNHSSREEELVEDILSIIQVFCCRLNGSRRYKTNIQKNKIEINFSSKNHNSEMES